MRSSATTTDLLAPIMEQASTLSPSFAESWGDGSRRWKKHERPASGKFFERVGSECGAKSGTKLLGFINLQVVI
jgi:hypothetical protein